MTTIKPKIIYRKGTAMFLECFISSFKFGGNSIAISWKLLDAENNVLDEDTTILGADVVSAWKIASNDDAVLENALLAVLQLERA